MADNSTDNVQVTSTDPSGATFATDIVGTVHYQEVKINVGQDGVDSLLGNDNPIPVIFTPSNNYSGYFVPVAGSTNGSTPIDVNIASGGTINVAGITLQGGTLDRIVEGVTTALREIGAGITMAVTTLANDFVLVSVTGSVGLTAGSQNIGDVDVLSVAIPSGVTTAKIEITGDGNTLPAIYVETGFRITNFGPDTAFIGPAGIFSSMTADGYPLLQYDSLFLECTGSDSLRSRTVVGQTADLRIIGT